nr:hypothetical protein Iba_chr04aCG10440 [Ipomoea batatas]
MALSVCLKISMFLVVIIFAVATAQDTVLSPSSSPSPAPGMDKGAAISVHLASTALTGLSLFLKGRVVKGREMKKEGESVAKVKFFSAETRGPPVRGGVAIEQRGSPGRGGVAVHQKPEGRGGVGRSGEAEAVGRSRSASAASAASAYRGLSAEAASALWTRGGGGC